MVLYQRQLKDLFAWYAGGMQMINWRAMPRPHPLMHAHDLASLLTSCKVRVQLTAST